ncbi:MAG: trypsin-like peptidase domain-containing protein, partial [Planctomycetes bacterium]|nr:trypsin-like peptidase domain-containing protein [Planctomycetota bacterium]
MPARTLLARPLVVSALTLVTAVPVAGLVTRHEERVQAEAMLDVSVSIRTISHVRVDSVGDTVWDAGSGSGLLADAGTCEVWTNHHVIADAAAVEVFPRGWQQATGIPAEVVGSTPRTDVAVLRMAHCEGLPGASLGRSAGVRAGDESYAVGNPLGSNPDSISRGIISHTERYLAGAVPFLQTDTPINPGNSGGALFDRDGRVIGINTGIAASRGGGSIGIGYAVPIDLVR